MESDKIEALLEKYFEAETTLAEEKELNDYFSSSEVATHLQQYRPLFGYFSSEKEQHFTPEINYKPSKRKQLAWVSIAASVVVLLGVGIYTFNNFGSEKANSELGTYDDPEEAFKETQKALELLSSNVNVGIESVQYVGAYEETKDKIFITK